MASCGVLALQGDFEAHRAVLEALGMGAREVRTVADLATVDALVMPGGESTAMLRLLQAGGLWNAIGDRVRRGMPVLATCAGVILLATEVTPDQPSLAALDVAVERNAYGRQIHSEISRIELAPELGRPSEMEAVFIRAPRISRVGGRVEVLGDWRGDPVLVRQGAIVAATFHPELAVDRRVHQLFIDAGEGTHEHAHAAAR